MKKTLLMAAAALAAGVISSQAQTAVYSANIVGYVNQVLPVGYSLVTVPVNPNATGNVVSATNVLKCLVGGDSVILWNGSGYSTYGFVDFGTGMTWQNPDGSFTDTPPNLTMGSGFFFQNGQAGPETNTFVGNVVLSNSVSLVVGYNLVGSTAPVAGALTNTASFNMPFTGGDSIIIWNGSGYSTYGFVDFGVGMTWQNPDGSFTDTPPSVKAAQGFFYQNGQATAETWHQNVVIP